MEIKKLKIEPKVVKAMKMEILKRLNNLKMPWMI